MGYLYQRKRRDGTLGKTWWVKYYFNGRPMRESTGTDKETEAKRFLKEREGRVATGQPILPRVDRIRYQEIAAELRDHYQTTGERDLGEADVRLTWLNKFFRGQRVAAIGGTLATQYIQWRQQMDVANSTINRELSVLIKMLRFAYERGKLLRLPVIHKLKEPPPRQGFFERDQFQAVCRRLPEHYRVVVSLAFMYGWRIQSEVLTLEKRQVDLKAGTLRLDVGTTKNDDGRLVYLTPELNALLAAQLERVEKLEKETESIIPYLFPHLTGRRRKGTRIRDFRKAWVTACRKAGCPGMLRHDLRRTAVRNMVNLGTPERVAMACTGHKTRSVFDRYHIVSPGDLQEVAKRLAGTI